MKYFTDNAFLKQTIARFLIAMVCFCTFADLAAGQKTVFDENASLEKNNTATCSAGRFNLTGNTGTSGTYGNIRTFSAGGVSVRASGFSRRTSDGAWETAYLGAYGSGLGVTNRGEGSGADGTHRVDNVGARIDYVLFEFNSSVIVDQAFLDSVVDDSDITVWVGTASDPFNNHLTLSDSVLSGFAPSEDNNASHNLARWADFNGGQEVGNVLVIAASTSDATPEDAFKIKHLDIKCPPNPCIPGTFDLTGSTATDGTDGNIRTYSMGGRSVKASGFSRRKSDGLWQTAYLGAYGGGLGVTDRGEGDGSNNTHKVDNIGDRINYVLFEFDRQVIVDQAFLDSIGDDSDITVWIGNVTGAYDNHQTLSDALLAGFAPSEDNNASNNSPRWANINAAQEVGNVLVIAASTSDADPEDAFKIKHLEIDCSSSQPARVTIIKRVRAINGLTASLQQFPYISTRLGTNNFFLVDADVVGPDRIINTSILNFGAENSISVRELPVGGWSLFDLTCTETGGTQNTTVNFAAGSVNIIAEPGESITCMYTNGQFGSTAAAVGISGRAVLANSRGASGATVTLHNANTGEMMTTVTGSFGYYSFSDLEVGSFYRLTISHKRYIFAESTRVFTLEDELTGVDFVQSF